MAFGTQARSVSWAAAAALLLGAGAAACGGGGGYGGGASPSATPSKETTSKKANEPSDPAAARKQVTADWEKFFDPATPIQQKLDLLEGGGRLRPALEAFSGDERVGQVKADVKKVDFTSSTKADVTYDLTLQGQTALPDATGVSVEEGGTWKVSAKSLCGLVQQGDGQDIPGC
ncbi:hypothetical protein [Streptomyces meridianus]|uniref:Low molecular weight antigen MTB12-like C-terminal domain-containing protein n=1 Tax=Streptomyces meridianus TaxID=2938945 RepID=A0ABT0X4I4_9ACTN|nr:hypothetical protein [Streptomyces meridianus]MCM2576572.1 hypothetical protein [Streptomyces meridianus]